VGKTPLKGRGQGGEIQCAKEEWRTALRKKTGQRGPYKCNRKRGSGLNILGSIRAEGKGQDGKTEAGYCKKGDMGGKLAEGVDL